jgi:predicted metalloprotease with PDZ domain
MEDNKSGYPVSATADLIAREIRNNTHTGKAIGDVMDQMERDHIQAEKYKSSQGIQQQQSEAIAARYTNTPRRNVEVPQTVPFNRDAAREQLKATYPWLDPSHPENPSKMWFTHQAKQMEAMMDAMRSGGDPSALDRYRTYGNPTKTFNREG